MRALTPHTFFQQALGYYAQRACAYVRMRATTREQQSDQVRVNCASVYVWLGVLESLYEKHVPL